MVAVPPAFVAWLEKLDVPGDPLGTPLITPIDVLSVKPVGRVPDEVLHVIGVAPEAVRDAV